MSEGSVHLQPLIGWPKSVHRGEEHLVTVDFRLHEESGEWPYDAEEVALTCVLDGGSAFRVESVDDNTVIVHRFGGTYSPTRFVVRATAFADLGPQRLALTVMSERGAVLRSDELRVSVLTDEEHEPPREPPRTAERLPRPPTSAMAADSRPFFFLSYARSRYRPEEADRWVTKFFNDLCADVGHVTGAPVPGFMEQTFSTSREWSDELTDALATCRVFVPLISPAYFSSKQCARELDVFLERCRAQAAESVLSTPVIPVMWTPSAFDEMPERLKSMQFFGPDFPSAYRADGIYGMMKLGRYREQYKETVFRLAHVIKERAAEFHLEAAPVRDPESERSFFDQFPAVSERQTVRVVLVAPSVDRLPPERDAASYGRTALEWQPFRSRGQTRNIAKFVMELLNQLGYRSVVESGYALPPNPPDAPTLVIVDPWAVRDDALGNRLRLLGRDLVHFLTLYDREDPQTMEAIDDLQLELSALHIDAFAAGERTRATSPRVFSSAFRNLVNEAVTHYERNS